MASTSDVPTKSGIKKLSNGESVIPASTRADGSVRKEIRIKPGYRPPEDVEVYKNRTAEAWKNRSKGGIPGATPKEERLPPQNAAAVAAKNAKRREARKKAAAIAAEAGCEIGVEINVKSAEDKISRSSDSPADSIPAEIDKETEVAKEARKLAKKLRQARELKDKKDKGDNLLPEQIAKVVKIQELIRQLESLGFTAEGEKKTADMLIS
ncbi:MAG: hypothetical protein FE78DRAFT_415300 [Acidomyces sp. 'richmondensis']|nr:MAG: hypothetical protein FE78DRAFT_415300 [Acidomyces sp. 'richmondensis']